MLASDRASLPHVPIQYRNRLTYGASIDTLKLARNPCTSSETNDHFYAAPLMNEMVIKEL